MKQPDSSVDQSLRCMEIWGGNGAFENAIAVSGMNAWIYSRPHLGDASGGDIHYISTCGHGHIARFAVVDVSGHGAVVGEIGVRLRKLMRKYINVLDQSKFARAINRDFSAHAGSNHFATAVLTSYYAPSKDLIVCNAGHPPPLFFRHETGTWQFLTYEESGSTPSPQQSSKISNIPMGIIDPTDYHQFVVGLRRHDLVILYSDAFIEAVGEDGAMLGRAGLLKLVEAIDVTRPETIGWSIFERLTVFSGNRPLEDDATMIVLHHNASDPPKVSIDEYLKVIGKALRIIRV